jgi:hypothetical protein
MQMLLAQINTLPTNLREKRPDVPEAIGQFVMRCLEKKADRRPDNAQVLINNFEYWEDEPARLDWARVEQERMAREKSGTKRTEREKADELRLAQEMQEAVARIKAERQRRASANTQVGRNLDSDANRFGITVGASAVFMPAGEALGGRSQPSPTFPGDPSNNPYKGRTGQELPTPPSGIRSKRWVVLSAAAITIGSGVWYFSARSVGVTNNSSARMSLRHDPPRVGGKGNNSETLSPISQTARPGVGANRQTEERAASVSQALAANDNGSAESREQAKPIGAKDKISRAGLEKQIRGWITEADVDYADGLYDDSIRLYEKALNVDPSNQELQKKIQRARKAKTTEESIH